MACVWRIWGRAEEVTELTQSSGASLVTGFLPSCLFFLQIQGCTKCACVRVCMHRFSKNDLVTLHHHNPVSILWFYHEFPLWVVELLQTFVLQTIIQWGPQDPWKLKSTLTKAHHALNSDSLTFQPVTSLPLSQLESSTTPIPLPLILLTLFLAPLFLFKKRKKGIPSGKRMKHHMNIWWSAGMTSVSSYFSAISEECWWPYQLYETWMLCFTIIDFMGIIWISIQTLFLFLSFLI